MAYAPICRAGYYSQCDKAKPNGPNAGTPFFGGTKDSGPFQGLQAERARIPFANVGLVKLPDEVSDDQAILLSDIFPTAYFGAELAEIKSGDTVAVFGLGPVGQFTIASANLLGAGRIFGVDEIPDRLAMARTQGAEVTTRTLTQRAPLTSAIEAYRQFDLRHSGWTKVKLEPAALADVCAPLYSSHANTGP